MRAKRIRKILSISLVSVFCLLTIFSDNATAANVKVKTAYTKKAKSISRHSNMVSVSYTIFKIKGSSVPLLAVEKRIASDTSNLSIYKYVNGKVKKLMSGYEPTLLTYRNYIMLVFGHESLEYRAKIYKYSSGKLKLLAKRTTIDDGRGDALYKNVERKVCKKCGLKVAKFKKIKSSKWKNV